MSAACFIICILSIISIICSLIIVIRSISAMCRAEKTVDDNVLDCHVSYACLCDWYIENSGRRIISKFVFFGLTAYSRKSFFHAGEKRKKKKKKFRGY